MRPSHLAATLAGAMARDLSDVPHLSGIFLNLNDRTAAWNHSQWVTDFTSMKDVGISFFVLWSTSHGIGNCTQSGTCPVACPYGEYKTYYPTPAYPASPCFTAFDGAVGNALPTMLGALEAVGGMKVHLGLASTVTSDPHYALKSWANYTALLSHSLDSVWAAIPAAQRALVDGVYTMAEPHNGYYPWASSLRGFASFLQNFSSHAQAVTRSDMLVWMSPYATGNTKGDSNATQGGIMGPSVYGDWWRQVFELAPAFGTLAMQDHVGQGRPSTLVNVTQYLPRSFRTRAPSFECAASCAVSVQVRDRAGRRGVRDGPHRRHLDERRDIRPVDLHPGDRRTARPGVRVLLPPVRGAVAAREAADRARVQPTQRRPAHRVGVDRPAQPELWAARPEHVERALCRIQGLHRRRAPVIAAQSLLASRDVASQHFS